jgi:MmyB-like transcription regulator ligand binding domain
VPARQPPAVDHYLRGWMVMPPNISVRVIGRASVRVNGRGVKRLLHPRVGTLTVELEALTPLPDPTHRLVIYRAADATSRATLDQLSRRHVTA